MIKICTVYMTANKKLAKNDNMITIIMIDIIKR